MVTAAVVCVFVSSVSAQYTVGAKGTFAMGVGTTLQGDMASSFSSWAKMPVVGGGGAVFFRADFIRVFHGMLGAQAELSFSGPYGIAPFKRQGDSDARYEFGYAAMDIPLIVTCTLPFAGIIRLVPGIGVNFSVPLGDMSGRSVFGAQSTRSSFEMSHFSFGMVFNVAGEMRIGPGSVMAELRFLNDFTPVRVNTLTGVDKDGVPLYEMVDMLSRRALQLSVGYQVPLPF